MEEKYVFGIDLGTTYSCISYLDENGQVVVCPSIEGGTTTPSVVRLEDNGDAVVGEAAKNTAEIYADRTIQFVKARIGKDASFNYGPDLSLTTTPIAVSAEILKKLANDAGNYTNSTVKRVVITVPAYFGDPEKKATQAAGIEAGLDVLGIVEEPTAAALYYGVNKSQDEENIIVFDLGGGTFDVTAMECKGTSFKVITTEGDHDLGGKNCDSALIDLVKMKFEEETGWDEEYDSDIEQELVINAEKAKIMLTGAEKASVPVSIDRQHRAAIEITRTEFEQCTANLMDKAISLTQKVLDRVSERGIQIDKMLLVGGSTYMPQVKAALEKAFPGMELFINEPNSAVSKGATMYAYSRIIDITGTDGDPDTDGSADDHYADLPPEEAAEQKKQVVELFGRYETLQNTEAGITLGSISIKTVATKSLGLEVRYNGEPKVYNLIMKDTELPVTHTEVFPTSDDGAKLIDLNIYQVNNYEEFYDIDEDLKIGTAMLKIHTELPKGSPIEVTLSISLDGMIHVRGVDLTHHCEIEADIENDAVGQA